MPQTTERTVLVVDDDSDIRTIVADVISMLGYTAVQASAGEQALAMFREIFPDLIVLDVMMPGKDGNEVCREIKQSIEGQFTPILMLTARAKLADKVLSLEGGADDYLTKPFHYEELQARIRALMRIRELNIRLREQNEQLKTMQERVIQAERQAAVSQLAGTAAHRLGQPLSAILLNCHLAESLPADDPRVKRAIEAIKQDIRRMSELIQKLKQADAERTKPYSADSKILDIDE